MVEQCEGLAPAAPSVKKNLGKLAFLSESVIFRPPHRVPQKIQPDFAQPA